MADKPCFKKRAEWVGFKPIPKLYPSPAIENHPDNLATSGTSSKRVIEPRPIQRQLLPNNMIAENTTAKAPAHNRTMKIIIVEDDSMMQSCLRLLFERSDHVEWVKGFDSAEQAIKEAPWAESNILLSDIDLPGISGIELINWVNKNQPHIQSVAHTINDNPETIFSAIKAGADGYLIKGKDPHKLTNTLHDMHQGTMPIFNSTLARSIENYSFRPDSSAITLDSSQHELLNRVKSGYSPKNIARELCITNEQMCNLIQGIYCQIRI